MVDLPDGGVLGHEQPVSTAQLRNVPQEHQSPGDLVCVDEGQTVHHHRRLCAAFHLLNHRATTGEPGGHRRLVDPERPEGGALGVGVEPETVQRRDGVG